MQELWDLLLHEKPDSECEFEDTTDQYMVLLSQEACSAKPACHIFRLCGTLQGLELLILLDSSSSHYFINSIHCTSLSGLTPMRQFLSVRVTNGSILQCVTKLDDAEWSIQYLQFKI